MVNNAPSEGQFLARATDAAILSLVPSMMMGSQVNAGPRNYIAFIGQSREVIAQINGKSIFVTNAQGNPIDGSIEDLVQEHATNPECFGIVPFTKEATIAVEDAGLKVKYRGNIIPELNYSPHVYSL